jgi:hypothetical protein
MDPVAEKEEKSERELTGLYASVQSAIWLIGLAILFWTGWWFPGILILVAISGITQAALQARARQDEEKGAVAQQARAAAMAVPATCPTCGAAISASSVNWTGPSTASCPYCKAAIPLTKAA